MPNIMQYLSKKAKEEQGKLGQLQNAILIGNINQTRNLLKTTYTDLDTRFKNDNTILHLVATKDETKFKSFLRLFYLDYGLEKLQKAVNHVNKYQQTPCYLAANNGDSENVKLFLACGAKASSYHKLPLNSENYQLLLKTIGDYRKNPEAIEDLIFSASEKQRIQQYNLEQLRLAILAGDIPKTMHLLKITKADLNTRFNNFNNATIFHIAAALGSEKDEKNNIQLFKLLIKKFKDEYGLEGLQQAFDKVEDNSLTPAHYAAHQGNVKGLKLIIACDGNVTAKNKDGDTPENFLKMYSSSYSIASFYTYLENKPDIDEILGKNDSTQPEEFATIKAQQEQAIANKACFFSKLIAKLNKHIHSHPVNLKISPTFTKVNIGGRQFLLKQSS